MSIKTTQFAETIKHCWQRATCWESWQPDWHHNSPAYGQCLVTSLLALEVLEDGWQLEECLVTPPNTDKTLLHYRLQDAAGQIFDPTQDQFPANSITVSNGLADPATLLADENLQRRLALLRSAYQQRPEF